MRISRKAFLRALGSAAALSTAAGAEARAAAGPPVTATLPGRTSMANDLSAALFLPHVGTRFRVVDSHGASTELELASVEEVTCEPCLEQFTLIFRGAAHPVPLDGVYRFEHAALEALTLFITPAAGTSAERSVYQASFSLMRDTARGTS